MTKVNDGEIVITDEETRAYLAEPNSRIAWFRPASETAVRHVLAQSDTDDDGRSEWLWVRLANGDLLLGVFPQGDTYCMHEEEHGF